MRPSPLSCRTTSSSSLVRRTSVSIAVAPARRECRKAAMVFSPRVFVGPPRWAVTEKSRPLPAPSVAGGGDRRRAGGRAPARRAASGPGRGCGTRRTSCLPGRKPLVPLPAPTHTGRRAGRPPGRTGVGHGHARARSPGDPPDARRAAGPRLRRRGRRPIPSTRATSTRRSTRSSRAPAGTTPRRSPWSSPPSGATSRTDPSAPTTSSPRAVASRWPCRRSRPSSTGRRTPCAGRGSRSGATYDASSPRPARWSARWWSTSPPPGVRATRTGASGSTGPS